MAAHVTVAAPLEKTGTGQGLQHEIDRMGRDMRLIRDTLHGDDFSYAQVLEIEPQPKPSVAIG
jgi:hypothetical protein